MSDTSNAEDLSDLPLNQDGTGGTQQDTQLDNLGNDRLDALLDEHIKDTTRDQTTRQQPQDRRGTTTQDQSARGQASAQGTQGRDQQNQQRDTQQRGQGNVDDQANGRRPFQQRTIGPFLKQGPDGHVYDQNGRKVAAAGAGYTVATRIANLYEPVIREHAALKQRLEAVDSSNEAARRAGLSLEESALGQRLMVSWKQDPLKTIEFLLNQAQESGRDVSSIRGGGSFDTTSLLTSFEERLTKALEPFQMFVRNAEQEQQRAELMDQVEHDLNEFYAEFPLSRQHSPILARIMEETGYGPREAWFKLEASAAQHGWDLSKSLVGQAQDTVNRRTPNGGGGPRLPDMGGRRGRFGNGGDERPLVPAGSRELANADDSWDSIVGGVLQDHGVQTR